MAMRTLRVITVILCLLALTPGALATRSRATRSTHSQSHSYAHPTSRKSHIRGHGDGRYAGGHGKNHKGGHYTNRRTGNHYRDRKAGVSR